MKGLLGPLAQRLGVGRNDGERTESKCLMGAHKQSRIRGQEKFHKEVAKSIFVCSLKWCRRAQHLQVPTTDVLRPLISVPSRSLEYIYMYSINNTGFAHYYSHTRSHRLGAQKWVDNPGLPAYLPLLYFTRPTCIIPARNICPLRAA